MLTEDDLKPIYLEDAAPTQVPVRIDGRDMLLCEVEEDLIRRYNDARMLASAAMSPDADSGNLDPVVRMAAGLAEGYWGTESILVALCLFYRTDEGNRGQAVDLAVVRSWRPSHVRALFERARKLNEDASPYLKQYVAAVDIEKRIGELQKQLKSLNGKPDNREQEADREWAAAKNSPGATAAGST